MSQAPFQKKAKRLTAIELSKLEGKPCFLATNLKKSLLDSAVQESAYRLGHPKAPACRASKARHAGVGAHEETG